MNKQQITNLIGAGTMAAVILAIFMLIGGSRLTASTEASSVPVQAEIQPYSEYEMYEEYEEYEDYEDEEYDEKDDEYELEEEGEDDD
ncbi:MAG: hypothetical protein QNJ45_24420 [Ardenticatenaceae bacterium]|nr:hypothetical protein [Ardenticatenaceae bacterium]